MLVSSLAQTSLGKNCFEQFGCSEKVFATRYIVYPQMVS